MKVTLKTKDDRFYAVINYKDGGSYKQKWVSLGLPVKNNKRKAEAMLDDIRREYASGYETDSRGDMMFTDCISRWLYRKRGCIALSTWEGYRIYAEKHIIPYFEPLGLSVRDIKPKHIQDYYQYKYTAGRRDKSSGGLSIPSIKKHSIVINEALDDAVLSDLIVRNPAKGVKLPAKNLSTRQKKFLTVESANKLMDAFNGNRLQSLVYTALYYGLRRSEVLGLRWQSVDFENGTLTINHTVVKNVTIVRKDTVKTQSSYHTYTLIDDVRNVLLSEKKEQEQNRRKYGREYFDSDYVFTKENGEPYRPDYITRAFQKVLRSHGIPIMRFHDLRHSTASILYDKGWDIKDIQSWLRHSSIDVTSDIYTHITEDRKSRMASELNSTFRIGSAQ